jgi:hypothetical protein
MWHGQLHGGTGETLSGMMIRSLRPWHWVGVLPWCLVRPALAQDLAPRAYVITPVDSNAIVLTYSHLDGGLQFQGAAPITDATATVNLPIVSYYHSLDFLGRTATVTVAVPYGVGDFHGTVADVPSSAHRTGFLDSVVRFAVNLIGGPAMEPAEFVRWHQNTLVGMSLTISAPTGEYDPTRLINYGSNRFSFKPEIGYSRRLGNWLLDAYGGGTFFTRNADYYPSGRSQTEAPVGSFEGHVSYDFSPRLWVSLDANYWWGGATSLNGVENPATDQKNSRVGMTAAFPLTRSQSIKVSVSDGAYIRYGGNYKAISAAWQYGWIGWPKFR